MATSLGVELRGGTVQVEGDLDFRGTLAVDKQTPVGFQQVRMCVALDTPALSFELWRD